MQNGKNSNAVNVSIGPVSEPRIEDPAPKRERKSSEFDKFESLAGAIVQVPKEELDEQRRKR